MALLKSLKKVLTELGGTPDPKDSTTKTIAKIADNVSGGGGGESGVLVVTITADSEWQTFTCDKTFTELLAAVQSRTPVFCYAGNETSGYEPVTFSSVNSYTDGSGTHGQVGFNTIRILGDEEQYYLHETGYLISDGNTVTTFDNEFLLTPRT